VGLLTNLPISIQHSIHFVSHWNVGATWVPHALNERRETASTTTFNLGQSIVWLARPRVNVLLETLWTSSESVIGAGKVERLQNLYLSPGVRWAHNFESGLQIVPGVAMPIGVGPSAGEKGLILCLSFEHPFSFAHSKAKCRRRFWKEEDREALLRGIVDPHEYCIPKFALFFPLSKCCRYTSRPCSFRVEDYVAQTHRPLPCNRALHIHSGASRA
jgi:hypothetical protein